MLCFCSSGILTTTALRTAVLQKISFDVLWRSTVLGKSSQVLAPHIFFLFSFHSFSIQ